LSLKLILTLNKTARNSILAIVSFFVSFISINHILTKPSGEVIFLLKTGGLHSWLDSIAEDLSYIGYFVASFFILFIFLYFFSTTLWDYFSFDELDKEGKPIPREPFYIYLKNIILNSLGGVIVLIGGVLFLILWSYISSHYKVI